MSPNLKIIIRWFKKQINECLVTTGIIGLQIWRIVINNPYSVPGKSMLLQRTTLSKLYQEIKTHLYISRKCSKKISSRINIISMNRHGSADQSEYLRETNRNSSSHSCWWLQNCLSANQARLISLLQSERCSYAMILGWSKRFFQANWITLITWRNVQNFIRGRYKISSTPYY